MFDEYCEPCGEVRWGGANQDQRDKYINEEFGLIRDGGLVTTGPTRYSDVVHAPASNIKNLFKGKGWNYDEYITITSVRNPWARIVSLYHFLKGKEYDEGHPFSVFVRRYLNAHFISRWNTYKSTYEMIHDDTGTPLIDYVVRLEHLKEDLNPIIEQHFPDFRMDYNVKINTTEHKHYSTYYDDKTKSIVADVFSYDIERWGYKFGY